MGPVNSTQDPLESLKSAGTRFKKKKKEKKRKADSISFRYPNIYLVCVWLAYFLSNYFTIQFIFVIIHKSHCTILTNIYFYL